MTAALSGPPPVSLAPYVEYARKAFAREATYRFEVFTEVGSLVLRVYLFRSVWTALYAQNAAPANIPLHAMLTYATVALLMSLILEVDGTRAIRDKVREGQIATDLMKPVSFPLMLFADGAGRTVLHALLVIPSLVVALLMVHVDVPSPAALGAFALTFLFGYAVNFCLNFAMNVVAFWTLESFALQLTIRWVSDLLSGQLIPLTFFPGIFGAIVERLPFAAIYSTPLRIYIGDLPPDQWLPAMLIQLGWAAVFGAISYGLWKFAERRVVVQGG